jgi:hypothetical protein
MLESNDTEVPSYTGNTYIVIVRKRLPAHARKLDALALLGPAAMLALKTSPNASHPQLGLP